MRDREKHVKPFHRALLSFLAFACTLPAAAETVRGFPLNTRKNGLNTLVAGRDGFLYGVSYEDTRKGNGAVFCMEPGGKFRVLHRFPFHPGRPVPGSNKGGYSPTNRLTMGKDGCLYGLTGDGGRFAGGVFYRVRPDGGFSVVADLPRSFYSPYSSLFQHLIEGPENAFYGISGGGAFTRLGLDGSVSSVGNANSLGSPFADPAQAAQMIFARGGSPGGAKEITMSRVRITDGAILSQVTCPAFASPVTRALPFGYSSRGLLVKAEWSENGTGGNRLYWMKADGSLDFIDDFPWQSAAGDPPHIQSFVHIADDGTIYYLTGPLSTGSISGGSTLMEYKPDGTHQVVCGFGTSSMFSFTKAAPDMFYAVTPGTSLFAPQQAGLQYSADWMQGSSGKSQLVKSAKSGGMLFQVTADDSPEGDFFPLAAMDFASSKGDQDLVIAPLKNDRDPAREQLHLVSVGPASLGSASTSADPKLKDQVLYSPAAAGRRSAIIPYVVADESGRQSTGTIWFRGNAAGTYQSDDALLGAMFSLRVTPSGKFSVTIPWITGKIPITGELDWKDSASVSVPASGDDVLTLKISLLEDENLPPGFSYVLSNSGGGATAGIATRVP